MNLSSRGVGRSFLRILLASLSLGVGGGLAGSLAGCSGAVGSGNGPDHLVISAPSATAPLPSLQMYECLTSGLRALMYFQDGSVGDFTNRVTWSTSNAGAVKVSNGDVEVGASGLFYPHGTLVPVGQGNAIVTASYFGIIGQTAVSVGTPGSVTLKAVIEGNYVPLTSINPGNASTTSFSMGEGSQQQLAVTAVLNNVETDVSNFATFGFKDPNPAVATFTGTGVLNAGRDGGPVVPQASFAPCSMTTITDPNNIVEMRVTQVQSIVLQSEFQQAGKPLPQLIVGNSERFRVMATLNDGNTQDVSLQSALSVSGNSTGASFGGLSGVNNLLFVTNAGGPLILNATFNGANAGLNAPSIVTSAVNQVLQSFNVCVGDLDPTIPSGCKASQSVPEVRAGSLTPLQLHAIGYYGQDDSNTAIYQDITRVVSWNSNNSTIATVSSGGNAAGRVLGVQQGSVIVEAQDAGAINIPQIFTQVLVDPPN